MADSNEKGGQPPPAVFLTEHQLAARHQRSVKTLRNARLRKGPSSIPFVKWGRSVRYRLSDVEAWEGAHLRHSTSERGDSQ